MLMSLDRSEPLSQAKHELIRFSLAYMKDEDRRRRLVEYFDAKLGGDRARLIRMTGFSKGRVSQLFDPGQPFGERAAAGLALKLGLSPDYFERESPQTLSPAALELAALYDAMTDGEKSRLKLLMQAARDSVHSPTPPAHPRASSPQPAARTAAARHMGKNEG